MYLKTAKWVTKNFHYAKFCQIAAYLQLSCSCQYWYTNAQYIVVSLFSKKQKKFNVVSAWYTYN